VRDTANIAARFASALDRDDYAAVATLLADDCEYLSPKGILRGPHKIITSYREASEWAKAHIHSRESTRFHLPHRSS